MFKDKALYVQMVNKSQAIAAEPQAEPENPTTPEWINQAIKEQVTHVAVTVAALMVVAKVLHTLSELTLMNEYQKNKKS